MTDGRVEGRCGGVGLAQISPHFGFCRPQYMDLFGAVDPTQSTSAPPTRTHGLVAVAILRGRPRSAATAGGRARRCSPADTAPGSSVVLIVRGSHHPPTGTGRC